MAENPIKQYFKSLIGSKTPDYAPPFTKWLGAIIREVGDSTMTVEFEVTEQMTNPGGYLHGGVHAAIMDEVIGMTVAALEKEFHFVSVNLSIDFLGNVRLGDKILAKATTIRQGRRIINMACEITDLNGKILSRSTSNMGVTEQKMSF
jgi:uncharacterized protein (TIGR00369 family)